MKAIEGTQDANETDDAARDPRYEASVATARSPMPSLSSLTIVHPIVNDLPIRSSQREKDKAMKNPPAGWPRISSSLCYRDPAKAIDWLCQAFGFEVVLKVEGEGGRIEHSELTFGGGLIMVGGAGEAYERKESPWRAKCASPDMLGGKSTQSLCIYVDDVDAHCLRAKAAGAQVFYEPKNSDYGEDYWEDRSYGAYDPEGHIWFFLQRLRDPKPNGK